MEQSLRTRENSARSYQIIRVSLPWQLVLQDRPRTGRLVASAALHRRQARHFALHPRKRCTGRQIAKGGLQQSPPPRPRSPHMRRRIQHCVSPGARARAGPAVVPHSADADVLHSHVVALPHCQGLGPLAGVGFTQKCTKMCLDPKHTHTHTNQVRTGWRDSANIGANTEFSVKAYLLVVLAPRG